MTTPADARAERPDFAPAELAAADRALDRLRSAAPRPHPAPPHPVPPRPTPR